MKIRDYADKLVSDYPISVSGQNGSDTTFSLACRLVKLGLSDSECLSYLETYSKRCDPPWTERELKHKINDASRACAHYRNR
jgi:hypothetical protein